MLTLLLTLTMYTVLYYYILHYTTVLSSGLPERQRFQSLLPLRSERARYGGHLQRHVRTRWRQVSTGFYCVSLTWDLGFIVLPCAESWVLLCFLAWELGFIVFPWPGSWVLLCFPVLGDGFYCSCLVHTSGFYSLLLYLLWSYFYYCTAAAPDPSARPS